MGSKSQDKPAYWRDPAGPLRVGISRCLLGDEVRFDGQHKRDGFLVEGLGPFVEWVPVCPEVEAGMGIPREPVRLVKRGASLRVLGVASSRDHTAALNRAVASRVRELREADLVGYVLKKDSPSCGMDRVKIYPGTAAADRPERKGRGVFAAALIDAFPTLPIEEEGRLNDPILREGFIERLFAYQRLQTLFAGRWTRGDLVAFHTAHKLALLAHSTEGYRRLGRLVAEVKERAPVQMRDEYETQFMATLMRPATRGRHTNVLEHMVGYLRKGLGDADRAELAGTVTDYSRGLLPLVVPMTLLKHHVRALNIEYLMGQTYLAPHPKELMLRNHV